MKTYTITNQKGGAGKSSTAQALGSGFTLKGYKTLIIDLDAQGNTSFTLGARRDGATALGVLLHETSPREAIQHTRHGDIIAGSRALSGADAYLTETGKEYRLIEALDALSGDYDYCIIDTPPALGILTINALTACNSVIIPAQPDLYSLQGISDLAETLKPVKRYCNPALKVEGILLTRYNARSSFTQEVADIANDMAKDLNSKVFRAKIREAVSIRKAQAVQKSIFEYDPLSKVAQDYRDLIEELDD